MLVSGTWWKNLGQNVHGIFIFCFRHCYCQAHTIHFQRKKDVLTIICFVLQNTDKLDQVPEFSFLFFFLFSLNVKGIPFTLNKGEMRKESLTGYWEFNTQIPSKLYGVLLRITLHT